MRSHLHLFRGFLAAGLGGMLFCSPATGLAQTQFKIETLTPNNVSAIEVNPIIGDDRSGIAVSPSTAFLTGDNGTGAWNRDTLTGGTNVGFTYNSIVMDLNSETVYTLADALGNPIPNGGGTVAKLVELDPVTGALTANVITLSSPFSVGSSDDEAGLFSGYDRIVVVDGNNAVAASNNPQGGASNVAVYNIELPSGVVTQLPNITNANYFNRETSENWATWGVAEFFNGDVSLVYVSSNTSQIDRINLTTNVTENVADFSPQDLSDSACFTVLPSQDRWYFHYEGGGSSTIGGGGRDETLGFADATFTIIAEPALVNISTRAAVGTGENAAIAGFILRDHTPATCAPIRGDGYVIPEGQTPAPLGNLPPAAQKRVLIRGLGPSLQSMNAAITGPLPDPVLELYNGNGNLIAYNNNWRDTQQTAIADTGMAPGNDLEAAMIVTLASDSNYTALLRGKNDTTGVGLVEVFDLQTGSRARLLNLSTRAFVGVGDDVLIGGIMFSEGMDAPPRVLLRAIGPSMTALGVSGALADPTIELYDANAVCAATNDNWMDSPDRQEIIDSGLAPTNDLESAILFTPVSGGMYTAVVRGVGGTTGLGLVEAYRLPSGMMMSH